MVVIVGEECVRYWRQQESEECKMRMVSQEAANNK